jgi:dGTPase
MFDDNDHRRSAEAEIMDWADDVAYAVHDLEDFYRAGVLPIDRLRPDSREYVEFLTSAVPRVQREVSFDVEDLRDIFEDVASLYFLTTPYDGTRVRRALLRRSTSSLINRYIGDPSVVTIGENDSNNRIRIEPRYRAEVELLKHLTWHYVISNPALATAQYGQRIIIRELFRIFSEASHHLRDRKIFPISFQERLDETEPELYPRLCADLIASMTERQAHATYLHLAGMTIGSVMERFDA